MIYDIATPMRFGPRLAETRKKKKLTADSLARMCGISRSYVTLMESGKRMPGKNVIPRLSTALGLKTNVVVNWYLEDLREKLL